jgi:hypothetical protein
MKSGIVVAVLATVLLTGCAVYPPLDFTVPNVKKYSKKLDAELGFLTVEVAGTGDRIDDSLLDTSLVLQLMPQLPHVWEVALIKAVSRADIFQYDVPRKVDIYMKIRKLDIPTELTATTVETIALYEVIERKSRNILYSQEIAETVVRPGLQWGEPIIREVMGDSVRASITKFLDSLVATGLKESP